MITTPPHETIPLIARLSLDHPEAAAIVARDIAGDPERYAAAMAGAASDPDARRVLLLAAVHAHRQKATNGDGMLRPPALLSRWIVEQRSVRAGAEQLTELGTVEAASADDATRAAGIQWPAAAKRSPRYRTGRIVVRPA